MTMFCAGNVSEVSIDEDIVNVEDYIDENDLVEKDNESSTLSADQESSENSQAEFLERLFASAYEKDELLQAIIDAKVKGLRKLPPEILKQVKLSTGIRPFFAGYGFHPRTGIEPLGTYGNGERRHTPRRNKDC